MHAEIQVTLTFESPFSISSGAPQGTLAKRGLMKGHDGWPFVPATAFKGRLRHSIEQVAGALPGHWVCDTHRDMCPRNGRTCAVCALFGSPRIPGTLLFEKLVLSGPPEVVHLRGQPQRPPQTVERYGVAINRRRGVAQDQMLYTTELLFPGIPLAFSGVVRGDLTPAQAALIQAGLSNMAALGQSKSSGLGWLTSAVVVTLDTVVWPPARLKQALEEVGAS